MPWKGEEVGSISHTKEISRREVLKLGIRAAQVLFGVGVSQVLSHTLNNGEGSQGVSAAETTGTTGNMNENFEAFPDMKTAEIVFSVDSKPNGDPKERDFFLPDDNGDIDGNNITRNPYDLVDKIYNNSALPRIASRQYWIDENGERVDDTRFNQTTANTVSIGNMTVQIGAGHINQVAGKIVKPTSAYILRVKPINATQVLITGVSETIPHYIDNIESHHRCGRDPSSDVFKFSDLEEGQYQEGQYQEGQYPVDITFFEHVDSKLHPSYEKNSVIKYKIVSIEEILKDFKENPGMQIFHSTTGAGGEYNPIGLVTNPNIGNEVSSKLPTNFPSNLTIDPNIPPDISSEAILYYLLSYNTNAELTQKPGETNLPGYGNYSNNPLESGSSNIVLYYRDPKDPTIRKVIGYHFSDNGPNDGTRRVSRRIAHLLTLETVETALETLLKTNPDNQYLKEILEQTKIALQQAETVNNNLF